MRTVSLPDAALPSDHPILATGVCHAAPPVAGFDGPDIFALRSVADATRLRAALDGQARRPLVIGGGCIGLELAAVAAAAGWQKQGRCRADDCPRARPAPLDPLSPDERFSPWTRVRGAIIAIPKGEIEAARALGLGPWLRLRLVVMPRAIRIAWPAYTNEVVYQIQATSLVSVITIMDITGVTRAIGTRDFRFYEAFGMAAAMYLLLVYGVLLIAARIEHRLAAHTRRSPAPARLIPDLTR
ncbi:FAD-dependent oxidoreductase [Paracoccus gahaiensis]|uniref:FAD-dependent oxidoreductase n=1 Tax=Paracoccus gahaiensis TaxID=1706839 RepID=UPI001FE8000B|nr:FAD-dependent oxidoreductase [Paracoccus gahaiensis]